MTPATIPRNLGSERQVPGFRGPKVHATSETSRISEKACAATTLQASFQGFLLVV